jgi:hypothetical protein
MEEYYEIIERGDENFHHILLKKKFEGIEYQYGEVQLIEENDTLRVKFEFEVFANPKKIDTSTRAFNDHLGRILMENLHAELLLIEARKERLKNQGNE